MPYGISGTLRLSLTDTDRTLHEILAVLARDRSVLTSSIIMTNASEIETGYGTAKPF